jgi:hypothetical protein
MGTSFTRTVQREFLAKLPARFPAFRHSPSALPRASNTLFVCRVDDDLWFFIYAFSSVGRNEFTIEIAWNTTDNFPFGNMPLDVLGKDGSYLPEAMSAKTYRARISAAFGLRRDIWWAPQARATAA